LRPVVLSIAGLDPGGGAGTLADVKTIEAHGCWAAAVVTMLTVQTIERVDDVHAAPAKIVTDQIAAVFADHRVAAVKIGLLGSATMVSAVARGLAGRDVPIVLDPVCASTSGQSFLDAAALCRLRDDLLPRTEVLTPNLKEALLLSGLSATGNGSAAAKTLLDLGVRHVLITGGEPRAGRCEDRLFSNAGVQSMSHRAIGTDRLHGTGCLHSSSVASRLARGESVLDAARGAGEWLQRTIEGAVAFGAGGAPDACVREVVS